MKNYIVVTSNGRYETSSFAEAKRAFKQLKRGGFVINKVIATMEDGSSWELRDFTPWIVEG